MERIRLGINIDHVATLRNARGGVHPDPLRAARLVAVAGGDQVTAHLREDRRHISDDDIAALAREAVLPLNMEMAATDEMVAIACRHRPFACCIVPERRQELTTEGGLDAAGQKAHLAPVVARLREAGSRVSLFVDPEIAQIEAAREIGADAVELHTGAYCDAPPDDRECHLEALRAAARCGAELGLEIHAGHGLSYETVAAVAAIPEIVELNIGHFLVGEAIFVGFVAAIERMRMVIDTARQPQR
ncbi:MAG: pyridoxine 5'-phosphate synthase [Alphaproteobacteria bacterium]|nr:MAG: pyridoxine 5'-phosphate synthase [Alphaproteobacteria bacterium]